MPVRVNLIATVKCEEPGCNRFDEHDDRPTASERAIGYFALTAKAAFEARGWFTTRDLTLCPDHTPAGKARAAGLKPKEKK